MTPPAAAPGPLRHRRLVCGCAPWQGRGPYCLLSVRALFIRASLHPLLGKWVCGPLVNAIGAVSWHGTVFGAATSMGIGLLLLHVASSSIFGLQHLLGTAAWCLGRRWGRFIFTQLKRDLATFTDEPDGVDRMAGRTLFFWGFWMLDLSIKEFEERSVAGSPPWGRSATPSISDRSVMSYVTSPGCHASMG